MRGRICKRAKGSWTMVVDVGRDPQTAKRKQLCRAVKGTKKDAERELRAILTSLDTGFYVKPTRLTVGEYLEQWLRDYAAHNTGPRTYERYREIVRAHLAPALGSIPLVSLQPHHVQSYYSNALASGRRDGKGGLSAQTVHHHHTVLSQALRYAVKHNMLVRNIAEAVDPPRAAYNEMATTDTDGINRLLEAAADTPYYVLIYTTIFTGLRRSELLALRWSNVDLDMATLSVTESLHHLKNGEYVFLQPKSKRARRSVALSPALAILLREHKAAQTDIRRLLGLQLQGDDLVFAHPDGRPIRPETLTRSFRRVARSIGLPKLRFHDLRHTHATLMLQQGIHPKIVSERLGHSSVGITLDTYSHVLPGLQEAAARTFEEGLRTPKVERQEATVHRIRS